MDPGAVLISTGEDPGNVLILTLVDPVAVPLLAVVDPGSVLISRNCATCTLYYLQGRIQLLILILTGLILSTKSFFFGGGVAECTPKLCTSL